ncbi:MAG TPA: hypothetical protein VGA08_00515, partial [Candidatus Saccharimonadales bacterium]
MVENKQILKRFIFIVAAITSATVLALSTRAQESNVGNGLRITPVRQELILTPGQTDSYSIELTNVSQGNMTVVSVVNDFESDNETGQPKLLVGPGESSPFSLIEYITLPEPFPLDVGETRTVNIE